MFIVLLSIVLALVTFLAGVYVGTRWSEKIKAVYGSIFTQ
jgi:hypothetical protein